MSKFVAKEKLNLVDEIAYKIVAGEPYTDLCKEYDKDIVDHAYDVLASESVVVAWA